MSEFYKYFKENMDALKLPAPESLFSSLQTAVANTVVILGFIDKFGKSVTIAEMLGAGTKLEGLAAIGACSAAFYVGAIIGSIAVATGRTLADGTSISDVYSTALRYGLARPWLYSHIQRFPAIYDRKSAIRGGYQYRNTARVVAA